MKATKGISRDTHRVVQYAEQLGFEVSRSKRHLKFTRPGTRTVYFSRTPSDFRACLNAEAKLRRAVAGVGDKSFG